MKKNNELNKIANFIKNDFNPYVISPEKIVKRLKQQDDRISNLRFDIYDLQETNKNLFKIIKALIIADFIFGILFFIVFFRLGQLLYA